MDISVRALTALASVNPFDIGLVDSGPSTDYSSRHIKSLTRVSEEQAQAVDVETGQLTGQIPYNTDLPSQVQE